MEINHCRSGILAIRLEVGQAFLVSCGCGSFVEVSSLRMVVTVFIAAVSCDLAE